jgi:predicted AlkP superfamily phosphohydrolase/phosphomutase
VVGWDGATFDVIHPLVEAGRLPNLARLMKTGSFGSLRSTVQPSSEQAWASFATGKNNGKHGIFGFVKRCPGTYEFDLIDGRARAGQSLWRILSDHGLRSIVVNVPLTYPPEPINGVIIGGLFSPGPNSQFTYPSEVYTDIVQNTGRYVIDIETPRDPVEDGELEAFAQMFSDRLEEMVRLRTQATLHLMARQPWDFCMVAYIALDRAQHKLWHFMDADHPAYDPELGDRYGHLIPDLYALLDEQLGLLLDQAGEETIVIIVSDHGFGPLDKAVYVNNWLAQRGYLAWQEGRRFGAITQRLYSYLLGASYQLASRLLPREVVHRLADSLMPKGRGKVFSALAFADVDWTRTQAYCIGSSNIYLNLQGREPQGIIRRETAEYQRVVDSIVSDLQALTDPDTNEPIVGDVYLGRELYTGPFAADAPDIAFLYHDCRYRGIAFDLDWRRTTTIVSRGEEQVLMSDLSGTHTMCGILVAHGPSIQHVADLPDAHIMDVAPTVLYLMGVPVPDDMDGKVSTGMILPSRIRAHPVQYKATANGTGATAPTHESPHSEADQKAVEERLRGLGYLD